MCRVADWTRLHCHAGIDQTLQVPVLLPRHFLNVHAYHSGTVAPSPPAGWLTNASEMPDEELPEIPNGDAIGKCGVGWLDASE